MPQETQDKFLIYVLGGPGSGKTTVMKMLNGENEAEVSGAPELEFLFNKISMLSFEAVTLDALRNRMEGVEEDINHPHPEKTGAHLETYKETRASAFREAFNRAADIYMDDHGDLPQQDVDFIRSAQSEGYKVILIHSTISPDAYLERQARLAAEQGYDPMKNLGWVVDIFRSSEKAFSALTGMADHAFIIDRGGWDKFNAYNAKKPAPGNNAAAVNGRWQHVETETLRRTAQARQGLAP